MPGVVGMVCDEDGRRPEWKKAQKSLIRDDLQKRPSFDFSPAARLLLTASVDASTIGWAAILSQVRADGNMRSCVLIVVYEV